MTKKSPIISCQFITKLINWSLALAAAASIYALSRDMSAGGFSEQLANWREGQIAVLVFAILTLAINHAISTFTTKKNISLPQVLMLAIVGFNYCSLFLGSGLNFYTKLWWWDDLLHATSGIIAGLIGFLLIYYLSSRHNMNVTPQFVALFVFIFAVAIAAFWEIFEFMWDWALKTSLQRWAYSDNMLIGHEWQGTGLRDTISDLILGTLGGLVAAILCHFLCRRNSKKSTDKYIIQKRPSRS